MNKNIFFLKRYYIDFVENIKFIRKLLYRKSILQLMGSVFFGVLGFWAEIGLAIALNGILVLIGLVDVDKLPRFMQSMNLSGKWIIFITCLFLLIRAVTLFWKQMISGIIYWDFKRRYEQILVAAAIADDTIAPISGAYVSSMIATGIPRAGNVIRALSEVLLGIVMVIPLIISLVYINLQLAIFAFIGIILVAFSSASLNRYVLKSGTQVNPIFHDFTERYLRSIRNRILLRIYGTTSDEIYECLQASQKFRSKMTAIVKWSALSPIISNFIAPIWLLFIIWMGLKYLTVSPGILLPFFYLFLRLGVYLSGLSGGISAVLADLPAVQELAKTPWISQAIPPHDESSISVEQRSEYKPILGVQEKSSERRDTSTKVIQIEARHLSAAYDKNIIFQDLSFFLPGGNCLGIIGPSGSGKSTLIALIAGIMKPTAGEILIDNIPPNNNGFSDFRRSIGYIGSVPLIKQGTIYENLIYGLNRPVDMRKIFEVLDNVQLHEISKLGTKGTEWMIYEGGEGLSEGQKQRICLARALLRAPRLLILDEATSNLDETTERSITDYLRQLKGKMTIIVASHRPHPLTLADQIIDLGNIAQPINPIR